MAVDLSNLQPYELGKSGDPRAVVKTQQDAADHCHSPAPCQCDLERCQWVATP